MYELQLVNNGFLAEYNEDNKVFVESILLDSETLKRLNSDDNDYADFIDVEFSPACKKVDRVDTLVAVTSGFMAFLLDQLLIRKNIKEKDLDNDNLDQYVQFEVMTGVEDIIEKLAEARNTSVQVDEKSMAELKQKFDPIKEGLEGMSFYPRIAFKQNQQAFDDNTNKKLKMIDAREVVSIVNMFNIDKFDSVTHPIKAYSSKANMLDMYLKDPEYYRKYVNIMPDIFDLYDAIETEFADAFNNTGGRYGRKKYAGYKDGKVIGTSKFGLQKIKYKIPDGLIYPAVAAFRSLVVYNSNTEKYEWKNGVNPINVWDKCKENMTVQIMNFATAIGDNPNAVGKDSNIWNLAYMTVLLQQGTN